MTGHDDERIIRARHTGVQPVVAGILEALPLALVGVDAKGRIVFANREAEVLFGYCRDELLGEPVEVLVPEALRAGHATSRLAFLRAPATRRMGEARDLRACHRDGHAFPVAISLKGHSDGLGDIVLAGIVDLSSQKALEAHWREQSAQLERRVAERTADLERRNREMQGLLRSLKQARAELERLSRHDPLTGLLNRREFDERAAREVRRALRRRSPTCLAMLDLDHFKTVNDRYGHAVGDRVLCRVAQILRAQLRRDDVVARYGGEEFIVLLPETGIEESAAVIERVRVAAASEPWAELQEGLLLTLSAGVASLAANEGLEAAIVRADRLLYEAKRQGRNRLVRESSEPLPASTRRGQRQRSRFAGTRHKLEHEGAKGANPQLQRSASEGDPARQLPLLGPRQLRG